MKPVLFFSLLCFVIACNSGNNYKKAEDPQDAGREFIRASLDGDYEKAQFYLLSDSINLLLMSKWQQGFDQLDASTKQAYKDASILPINIQTVNDSVTTYTFSNTFRKDTTTLRILRINNEWLVDLKEILKAKNDIPIK